MRLFTGMTLLLFQKRMKNRLLLYTVPGLVLFLIIFAATFYYLFFLDDYSKETTIVEIPKGASLRKIGSILEDNKLIRSKTLFLASAYLNGKSNNLKAGEYQIPASSSIESIIKKIANGDVYLRQVTIPEGKSIKETAEIFDKKGFADKDEFYKLATDPVYAKDLTGKNISTLEGYLYPDTYSFPKSMDTDDILVAMVNNFNNIYENLSSDKNTRLSDHQVIILASMIEKETGAESERENISAVFHNRLKKGMRLECDPTVIYGMGDSYKGNIRKKDLLTKTPYNTYQIYGLPAGPIANPGKEALHAALNPSDVNFLYFVSKGDGSHYFSSDYRSHVNAVNKYIRNRNKY